MSHPKNLINKDIKIMLLQAGLYQYQIAEELNLSQNYFTLVLNRPLTAKRREQILQAIDKLAKENDQDED